MLKFRFGLSFLLFVLLFSTNPAQGANILGLFSSHSQSHLILHMSVAKTLAEAGHNVTVVSMVKPTVMHKDIHLIVIPVTDEQEEILQGQMVQMASQKNSVFDTMKRLMSSMSVMIDSQFDLLSHPKFQVIYETKFDLMIMGWFINDFQLGVAAKLKIPVIIDWMQAPMGIIDDYVGNPTEVSYVPNMGTSVKRGELMGFTKRLQNLAMDWMIRFTLNTADGRMKQYYKDYFEKEPNFPSLNQMRKNISLVFANCHLISEGPIRPLVPAIVEIGGIQVKDTPNPLPQDIQEFLEKSTNGAILLSLGSNIKSSSVKPEIVQTIFKVLSGLKQNVIWKWEDLKNTPGNSPNILYQKWLPQDDILAHKNTKLFITHAGKGGITEAQYHGVPMVALPIFGDQPSNAIAMQNAGYGLNLELLYIEEESFRKALKEVWENKKYAEAIGKFSSLYRDRPLTARQQVLYWTEYVLRHKGAPHLQSPAVNMGTVAFYNLDVYALLITVLLIVLLVTRLVIKFIWRKLFQSTNKPKKTKKH